MKAKDVERFKKLLNDRKAEILNKLEHIREDNLSKSQRDASGDLSGYTFHMADVATDSYDREFSLSIATGDQKILYAIEEAFKRMDDGMYGDCTECEKPINKARLEAVPYAELCLACQEREEREQKKEGG